MTLPTQPFQRHVWLASVLLGFMALLFGAYVWSEKQVDRANDLRHTSILLADELRQSSDDLTRMARTYVITGDPRYKQAYHAILEIRDGVRPSPADYQYVFWDTVLAQGGYPALPTGPGKALLARMEEAGLTPDERALLASAKGQSDQLTGTEALAMALIEEHHVDAVPKAWQSGAIELLHDAHYHAAKAAIMAPINAFEMRLDARTQGQVMAALQRAMVLRWCLGVAALGLVLQLVRISRMLKTTLGVAPEVLFAHMARLGRGEMDAEIPVPPGAHDSVLGWLAKTHAGLRTIEAERNLALQRSAQSEAYLRTLIEAEPECIKLVDAQGRLLQMNAAGLAMIEADRFEQVANQDVPTLIAPEHRAAFTRLHNQVLQGHPGMLEFEIVGLKGGRRWLETHAVPFLHDGQPVQLAVTRDITERKASEQERQKLAFYDPVTQLPNRRLLLDRLAHALETSATPSTQLHALLFVDLDNFKTLNDTLGHLQGDRLLQESAQRLTTCVGSHDTVARLGSDEFVLILTDLGASAQIAAQRAENVGEHILQALATPYRLEGGTHHSSASIGITLFSAAQAESSGEPLKRAELAMFQAKAAGRNTLRFFETRMQEHVSAHAALEADLRQAMANDQLFLHLQPQVAGQGRITGAEALLRWEHPVRGLVSPAQFIPLAEETGLIVPIGQWVLDAACARLADWASQPALAQLTLAVNVSARQFEQAQFVEAVLSTLTRHGIDPSRLKLELTEGMLLHDVEATIAKMNALKERGVGFSLDDFGTGYSSLAYLKRLPLDQLKIDQGFVNHIVTDPNDAAIAKMVVALADSMGLSVIAEGVERQDQADLLARLGCHAYQGYLYSRPLSVIAFEALATAAHATTVFETAHPALP